jgi:hypothetical protein
MHNFINTSGNVFESHSNLYHTSSVPARSDDKKDVKSAVGIVLYCNYHSPPDFFPDVSKIHPMSLKTEGILGY